MKRLIEAEARWMMHLEGFLKWLNKHAEEVSKLPLKVGVKK